MQTLDNLIKGSYLKSRELKLQCNLQVFPTEILDIEFLEVLDLSNNQLRELPDDFERLSHLRVFFASNNVFDTYPSVLGRMPALEMVAFKNNKMQIIPENSFGAKLRWLILTNNNLKAIPRSIGDCPMLQKLMLAGNQLCALPREMQALHQLELIRISVNRFEQFPSVLLTLPRLAYLAFASNPCVLRSRLNPDLQVTSWTEYQILHTLGEGASGTIVCASWATSTLDVAIKIFKGEVTSDGSPVDEISACMTAGRHKNLINTIATIHDHPDQKRALVLELIAPCYKILGLPPTLSTCTRDTFKDDFRCTYDWIVRILSSVASAATHLHSLGILHGDLYAHNTLVDDGGHALLGDLGAATHYDPQDAAAQEFELLDVRAFGNLIDDLLKYCTGDANTLNGISDLKHLLSQCRASNAHRRPRFSDICERLRCMQLLIDSKVSNLKLEI